MYANYHLLGARSGKVSLTCTAVLSSSKMQEVFCRRGSCNGWSSTVGVPLVLRRCPLAGIAWWCTERSGVSGFGPTGGGTWYFHAQAVISTRPGLRFFRPACACLLALAPRYSTRRIFTCQSQLLHTFNPNLLLKVSRLPLSTRPAARSEFRRCPATEGSRTSTCKGKRFPTL